MQLQVLAVQQERLLEPVSFAAAAGLKLELAELAGLTLEVADLLRRLERRCR